MPNKYATVFNPTTGQRKVVKVGDPNAFAGGFQLQAANPNATRPVQTIDDLNRELQGAIGQYNQTQQTQYDVPQLVQQQLQQKSPEFGLSQEALAARYGNPQSPLYIENPFVREATITKALSNQQQAFSTVADKINSALGKRGLIEQQGVQGLQTKLGSLVDSQTSAAKQKQQDFENQIALQKLAIARQNASQSTTDPLKGLQNAKWNALNKLGITRKQDSSGGWSFFANGQPVTAEQITQAVPGVSMKDVLADSKNQQDKKYVSSLNLIEELLGGGLNANSTGNVNNDPLELGL